MIFDPLPHLCKTCSLYPQPSCPEKNIKGNLFLPLFMLPYFWTGPKNNKTSIPSLNFYFGGFFWLGRQKFNYSLLLFLLFKLLVRSLKALASECKKNRQSTKRKLDKRQFISIANQITRGIQILDWTSIWVVEKNHSCSNFKPQYEYHTFYHLNTKHKCPVLAMFVHFVVAASECCVLSKSTVIQLNLQRTLLVIAS